MVIILDGGLDAAWSKANEYIDLMPEQFIDDYLAEIQTLLNHHCSQLKQVLDPTQPENSELITFIDQTSEFIQSGDLREALRRLTTEFLDILPEKGQRGRLSDTYKHLYSRQGKAMALVDEIDDHGSGILPATVRLTTHHRLNIPYELEEFYAENLRRITEAPKFKPPTIINH